MTEGNLPDAQDLVYDAMEAWGTPLALERLNQALEIDPNNPDALTLKANFADTPEGARAMVVRAVSSAEERLGPKFEKTYSGIFWDELDTRPYMRALASLSQLEEILDNRKESIKIMERMLKLNPRDNQGIRYELIGKVLAERMLVKARKLLETYPPQGSAWFTWASVLYHFAMKDRPKATSELKKARKLNPYVEHFLSGAVEMPDELPDIWSPGHESEAVLIVESLGEAWTRRQHALFWLQGQLSGDPALTRHIARMIDGR